jgi:hypothetical protein
MDLARLPAGSVHPGGGATMSKVTREGRVVRGLPGRRGESEGRDGGGGSGETEP